MSEVVSKPDSQGVLTRWILNARLDAVLFVGTPLLILPAFYAASHRWSSTELFLIVSTFGALGHHAPGLMRAYGDRQLFRRFWVRFTVVPIACLILFSLYTVEELPGAMLVLITWGVWHFLMQTYGFARIYDAKVKSFDATTRYLDLAVCIAWSGSCILSAPGRVREFLALALKSGLSFATDIPLDTVRACWFAGTALVTLLFVANTVKKLRQGEPVNASKIVLFVTTFAFFWLCSVTLKNLLLGIAMFELFHDVQYLGIVWLFNRNRVSKDPEVGPFTRFLFRPGTGLLGAYLGLVLAYGFIGYAAERLTADRLKNLLFGLIATSNLMHFYFDGFIWKIREPETGSALGVSTGKAQRKITSGLVHAGKWAVLLVIVGCLMVAERSNSMTDVEQAEAILTQVPTSVVAHEELAGIYNEQARYLDAIELCRAAEEAGEPNYRTHMHLGVALTAIGQPNRGFAALEQAFQMNPRDSFLRFHLAMGHIRREQFPEAIRHLQAAVKIDPSNSGARYNLGALLVFLDRPKEAIDHLTQAVVVDPKNAEAHQALGEARLKLGDFDSAATHLKRSLELNPESSKTLELLAAVQYDTGARSLANDSLKKAVRLLNHKRATQADKLKAVALAEKLLQNTGRTDPDAFEIAATAYGASGRMLDAARAASDGETIAKQKGFEALAERLHKLVQQFSDESRKTPQGQP